MHKYIVLYRYTYQCTIHRTAYRTQSIIQTSNMRPWLTLGIPTPFIIINIAYLLQLLKFPPCFYVPLTAIARHSHFPERVGTRLQATVQYTIVILSEFPTFRPPQVKSDMMLYNVYKIMYWHWNLETRDFQILNCLIVYIGKKPREINRTYLSIKINSIINCILQNSNW